MSLLRLKSKEIFEFSKIQLQESPDGRIRLKFIRKV